MNKQYLVRVQDKNNLGFLKDSGNIIHVAKLRTLVVFETTEEKALRLSHHPQVISIRQSEEGQLAH